MRDALLLASTYNHLMMCQALAALAGERYRHIRVVWFGARPLAELADLQVAPTDRVAWVDLAGLERLKLWRSGGRAERDQAVARLREALDPWPRELPDVFLGNESQMFPQLVMDVLGVGWRDVTLYEEGIGFYAGAGRPLEKALINALLRLRRFGYREFQRDFSGNPRITRLACNHPALLERTDAEVLDTSAAYRGVVEAAAESVRARRVEAEHPPVDCLYVSGNLSGARRMTLEQELGMIRDIHRALTDRVAPVVHVKFHPRDDDEKRRAILEMGFVELSFDGPFEVEYLARDYRRLFSVRSSVMLNLSVLARPRHSRLGLIRSDREPLARIYGRRRVARVFDRMVAEHAEAEYFDPYGSP